MDEAKTKAAQEHREIFDRVWRRVMGDRAAESPVAWDPPEETAADTPEQPPTQTVLTPALPQGGRDRPVNDFPRSVGVLSEEEAVPALQELIRRELADWREYQALARRTGGGPARVFAGVGTEKKRHAKRLSAACFLISGVRYWPETTQRVSVESYLGALRRRFHAEQERMAQYLAAAEGTADPSLRQLYFENAKEAWDAAMKLRTLVEQV